MLAQTRNERWNIKCATTEATRHVVASAAFEEDDPERAATVIHRAWNNAPREIREHAFVLLRSAGATGCGLIDEENPIDA